MNYYSCLGIGAIVASSAFVAGVTVGHCSGGAMAPYRTDRLREPSGVQAQPLEIRINYDQALGIARFFKLEFKKPPTYFYIQMFGQNKDNSIPATIGPTDGAYFVIRSDGKFDHHGVILN